MPFLRTSIQLSQKNLFFYEDLQEKLPKDLTQFDPFLKNGRVKNLEDEEKERKKMEKVTKIKLFLPILSLLPKGKLLDVGCSYGNFLLMAKNKGFEVYGKEASETAVEIARKKYNLNVVKALNL